MEDLDLGSPQWWLKTLQNRQKQRLAELEMANRYYEGEHRLLFTSDKFQKVWGSMFNGFSDNWCSSIVNAAEERLDITGFRFGTDQDADRDIWEMWQANHLDADSGLAHVDAMIYREAYVLAWPDAAKPLGASLSVESPTQMIAASHPANRRQITAALKIYTDDSGHLVAYLYLPETVYRFRSNEQQDALVEWSSEFWVPEDREGTEDPAEQPSPTPGTVPVAVLPNRDRLNRPARSELDDIIPLQDAANKVFIDMLVASDQSAKTQRYVENWEAEVDPETNQAKPPPWDTADLVWFAPPPDGDGQPVRFGQFPGADLKGHLAAIDLIINHISSISRTPPHYLSPSADRLSGESIKSSETGLVSKVRRKQIHFGEGWEQGIRLALRIADDPRADFVAAETVWRDPEIRSEAELADAAIKRQQLSVPNRQLQQDIGYTPTQIDRFASMRAEEQLIAGAAEDADQARDAAEIVQKLAVAVTAGIVSADEARDLANRAGAQLTAGA